MNQAAELQMMLKKEWESFLLSWNPNSLAHFLEAHAAAMIMCGHEYPYLHRIVDVFLNGKNYRVVRCVTCQEALSFVPIDESKCTSREGVPYWLTGPRLRDWVEQVAKNPEDDEMECTDWDQYR